MRPLTARQQRFVTEYLTDLNATQAAIRSGYSQKTAASTANENLRKPKIVEAVLRGIQKRRERVEHTGDEVVSQAPTWLPTPLRLFPESHGTRTFDGPHSAVLGDCRCRGQDVQGKGAGSIQRCARYPCGRGRGSTDPGAPKTCHASPPTRAVD